MSFDPWTIDATQFPAHGAPAEQLAFAARYAVLAPSSHNSQPWLFAIHGGRLWLKADRTRALAVVDPDDRELVLSCGAALFHLRLALRAFGFDCAVDRSPDCYDADVLATVTLGERRPATDEERRLFAAITARRTNRQAFAERPVAESLVLGLVQAARQEGAWLDPATGLTKEAVAALIATGDRLQSEDPRFRRELASWLHPNRSALGDGMPGYAQGLSDLASQVAPFLVRTFAAAAGRAARDHELAVGSPLLAVLGSDGDGERDRLRAGEALAHVLLRATAEGLSASFLNQAVELPQLRVRLREALGKSGHPQLVLRFGYGPAASPTPRRPFADAIRITP
jgi:hypothetical protein